MLERCAIRVPQNDRPHWYCLTIQPFPVFHDPRGLEPGAQLGQDLGNSAPKVQEGSARRMEVLASHLTDYV